MRIIERGWECRGLRCVVALDVEYFEEWFSGFVAVPQGHPCWGKEQDQVRVNVHGGLTFAKHGPNARNNKDFWWFGFHCRHSNDDTCRDTWHFERPHRIRQTDVSLHKWTLEEVCAETEKLANQLANMIAPAALTKV